MSFQIHIGMTTKTRENGPVAYLGRSPHGKLQKLSMADNIGLRYSLQF